jgi:hypothetical protein
MKFIYTISSVVLAVLALASFFSFTKPYHYPWVPPTGYTGATVSYCSTAGCHSSFGDNVVNTGGGAVTAPGLPTSVTLGTAYNFSTVITHGDPDRSRFGFAIKALDANGVAVGTFTTTNTKAGVIDNEIGHRDAIIIQPEISYIYDNLTWTAPTVAPVYPITFYIAGNAGNGGQGSAGDYIYASTVVANAAVVPITLSAFYAKQLNNADVVLQWRTEQEINSDKFEIEKSINGQQFTYLSTIPASGFSSTIKDYKTIDKNPTSNGEYIYYRLKLIDKDGSFKYSDFAKVLLSTNETIVKNIATIHNGTNNIFQVNILSPNTQSLKINWINSNGQVIFTENKKLTKGSNTFQLQSNKIAKGEIIFLKFEAVSLNKSYSLVN